MLESLAIQAIGATPDHIYIVAGADLRCVFVNRAALAALELREDQIVGRTWREIGFPAHVMEPVEAEVRQVIATGAPGSGEAEFPLPSGIRSYQYVLAPIRGPDGQVEAVVCNVRDITPFARTRLAVEMIGKPVAATTGDEYLRALVKQLSGVLGLQDVFVGELIPPRMARVRMIARSVGGAPAESAEYDLADTPCAAVIGATTCVHASGVQRLFPRDAMLGDLGIESYVGVPLFDSAGQPLGLLAAMHTKPLADPDWVRTILELFAVRAAAELARRAADTRLRQAQQMLLEAERVGQFGSFEWDLATNEVRWSPGMYAMYGVDPATAPPITYAYAMSFVHPADAAEGERHVAQALSATGRADVEFRMTRPDGAVRVMRSTSSVRPGPDGKPARLVGVVRDMTDRAAVQEALRESERRYGSLVDALPIGIYRSTLDGRLLAANPAFVAMLGYDSEAELLALDMARDVYRNPADRARLVAGTPQAGYAEPAEVEWRRKDGTPITVRLTAARSVEPDGTPVFTALAEDVTVRRRLETQLLQSQRLEGVGRLAGGIAHDFNNILAVITTCSDLLVTDLPEGSPQRADAEEISMAASRAAALTRQMLAFSRQQVLSPHVLSVNDVVRSMGTMLRRILGEDITLVERLDAQGNVRADPAQLEQVLLNLVVNARDAMRLGGTLTIATDDVDKASPGALAGVSEKPSAWVRLVVEDTGVGMDADTAAHVFEPFFTTKQPGHGTGLGLATVYGIVTQSGGQVDVRSAPGSGTVFEVTLPRVFAEADWRPFGSRHQAQATRGLETVLLLEDDPAVRRVTHLALERAGYTVIEAGTAADAIALGTSSARRLDLLLSDVVMPEMNGVQVYEALRARHPGLRVVFMSGYAANVGGTGPVLPPGSPFLPKPFTTEGLTRAVREALDASLPAR